jgi:hypothetical protein
MSQAAKVLGWVAGRISRGLALCLCRYSPLASAVRALLNEVLPSGACEVDVVGGPLAGAHLNLDLQAEKYLWLGTYEPAMQEAMLRFLTSGVHAWDVGAFIGPTALDTPSSFAERDTLRRRGSSQLMPVCVT